jgi:actin-like ATPase involved in cell morphogenesis
VKREAIVYNEPSVVVVDQRTATSAHSSHAKQMVGQRVHSMMA